MLRDSLSYDTSVVDQYITTFLSKDSLSSFTKGMPIDRISEINVSNPHMGNWFALTILGLVIYLLLARLLFSFNMSESMKGFGKIQSIDVVGFDKEYQLSGYFLSPLSVFTYSFYLYFIINPRYLHINLDYLFIVFSIGIILLFLTKTLLEKTLSIIFNTQNTFGQYFSDHLFILGLSSLIQVPLIIIFVYSGIEFFLWISIGVLVLLWVFRLFRGAIIGIKQTAFSKSFIILYLCSLEILPLIIAYKMAIG